MTTVVVACMVAVLGACGGGGGPAVTEQGASELQTQVTAVRSAAAAHDADGAARALETLRTSVARLRRSGDVTDERAASILRAADGVEAQLVTITTTTTTTTTTRPAPTTTPEDQGNDKGKGNGNGKSGKGG
jgi:hypothetical protein